MACERQSAVVRGAAIRGLEGIAPRMKQSRRHYGVGLNMPFREGKDPEEKSFLNDFNDRKYCCHRVRWLISKVCSSRIISDDKVGINKIRATKFSKILPERHRL